jgi:hypothetical protein
VEDSREDPDEPLTEVKLVLHEITPDGSTSFSLFLGTAMPERKFVELPAPLRPAVDAVLADMQLPRAVPLTVRYYDIEETEDWGCVSFVEPDGSSFGFGVVWSAPRSELLVALAEGMQENFSEMEAAWGEARPPCPGHGHPLSPVARDGIAWWDCPATGEAVARIGSLCGRPS